MHRLIHWVQRFVRELRRRRVIRVAVVYATTAFVLLQLGEILVEPFGLPGWTLRMVTFLLVLGFPLAIGLAWVYNITEEGVVREVGEGTPGEETAPQGSPFTSNGLIVGLLLLVAGLLLYPRIFSSQEGADEQGRPPDTAQVDERSIAVLPFTNLSGTKKTRPLVRGLHDDLLTRLSNVSALKVISRTSVEQYRNTKAPLPAIADSLGVRWILEGGVQQADGKIQVNAQLIDPRDDVHRWADSYRRDLSAEGLFAIQGEVAGEITEALRAKLTPGEQSRLTGAPTEDLQAYRLYVEGRKFLDQRRTAAIDSARDYFRRALSQDSTYALAWTGLADARVLYATYAHADSLPALYEALMDAIPESKEAARRAVELDPDLAEAHTSLAYAHLLNMEGPTALSKLRRAVELKPSYAQAQDWLGGLLLSLGRPEAALRHLRLAVKLNPEARNARAWLNSAMVANGRYDEALAQARRRENPSDEALALLHLERWTATRSAARRALARPGRFSLDDPWMKACLAVADAATGDSASARRRRAELEDKDSRDLASPIPLGLVHAALGDDDATISTLGRIFEKGSDLPPPHLGIIEYYQVRYFYPDVFGPLRSDPRLRRLIREANRAWELNPDGSLPNDTDATIDL